MKNREKYQRIVIKVGTSSLTHKNGKPNIKGIESLSRVVSDLHNSGKSVILVSSGAIGVGMGKLGMKTRPDDTAKKQALAAIGQCELMFMYDKMFGEYSNTVAQVLLTAKDIESEHSRSNVENTFKELLGMDIIPIVNENDTVAVDELEGRHIGDNDTLSAVVAVLTDADLLVILTDIDGMYDADPRKNPDAKLIPVIDHITEEIESLAGGAGSGLGTGGMATKIKAAKITAEKHIPCCIMNGSRAENLYDYFEGREIGTTILNN